MQNFMKTIISAVKAWTDGRIQESVADWNENDSGKDSYIKNRTHYDTRKTETISYTFDGNLEGREIVPISDTSILVKISEDVPVIENLIGGEVKVHTPDFTESVILSKEEINVSNDSVFVAEIIGIALNNIELDGVQIKKGIWSLCFIDNGVPMVYAMELSYQTTTGKLKKLDSKYLDLPENIATTDDINAKMNMDNPIGTGSFSMNRKADTVIGIDSHAEGWFTTASGSRSHAEGGYTTASGADSHAEGDSTKASGTSSHAEGYVTTASGNYSHAEGRSTKATSSSSDTTLTTSASDAGYYTHAEGYGTVAYGTASHAEGNGTRASGLNSHSEGYSTTASGNYSHAEGYLTKAISSTASPSTTGVTTRGYCTHAEGYGTVASGACSHAEGSGTTASGYRSHAEGEATTASGNISHAEGCNTKASGYNTHAEGYGTTAFGDYSHTEGNMTTASGSCSHAEGSYTIASGNQSHAEGGSVIASGAYSHAEGTATTASGDGSHAEGEYTKASGISSHAEGYNTKASGKYSHAEGIYNIEDTENKYAHIVGNGTSDTNRSNAHTLDWNGVGWFQGGLQVGGTAQDDGAQTVMLNGDKEIILASSTEGSTKKFKLTIDDNGVLTASEIETTT